MKLFTLDQIKSALSGIDVVEAMENAFVAYSDGRAEVPPVGELILEKGEVHIKYGYIRNEEFYVIKIASGFYQNDKYGIPTGNGLMLLFRQETGQLAAILLDEGHLTNIRTAAAGAVAAKHLAPARIEKIGIVGTGVQARLQLKYLKDVTDCRDVLGIVDSSLFGQSDDARMPLSWHIGTVTCWSLGALNQPCLAGK